MIVSPKVRGFICTTSHPTGCAANVARQIDYVKAQRPMSGPKRVLIIGASTGYGLASRIVASFGVGAKTIGVFFEKEASGNRTASAGWYNSAAFETAAHQAGVYAKSVNGDAFSSSIKQEVIDLIQQDWGGQVDLIIYSLASPKRVDPINGNVYNSVLKPIQQTYTSKTLNVLNQEITSINIEPASDDEIENTVRVMGGDDWALWIVALKDAGVLAAGATTIAYSYLGPEITFPVYRNGTIGKAKEHLEATAVKLDQILALSCNGRAFVSVNKGLVTQASSAIPVVPLYLSILYRVMQEHNVHEGCIEQIYRLFADRLYPEPMQAIALDASGRIRIDDWEMRADIQAEVDRRWQLVNAENLATLADVAGYLQEFYNLFGFELPGVDYTAEVDIDVKIPSLHCQTV